MPMHDWTRVPAGIFHASPGNDVYERLGRSPRTLEAGDRRTLISEFGCGRRPR